jgi:hypothetical protein
LLQFKINFNIRSEKLWSNVSQRDTILFLTIRFWTEHRKPQHCQVNKICKECCIFCYTGDDAMSPRFFFHSIRNKLSQPIRNKLSQLRY